MASTSTQIAQSVSQPKAGFLKGINDWQAIMSRSKAANALDTLVNRLIKQHRVGLVALHATCNPLLLADRLEDRIILNNLRENECDTTRKQQRREALYRSVLRPDLPSPYSLQPTISATKLASSSIAFGQEIFCPTTNNIFVCFDLEQSRVRYYFTDDCWSTYAKNHHDRLSYMPDRKFRRNDELSYQERLEKALEKDQLLSQKSVKTRRMNEMLIKIDGESAICMGFTTDYYLSYEQKKTTSDFIYKVKCFQTELFHKTGIAFPVFIYNNRRSECNLKINGLEFIIKPNQFLVFDTGESLFQDKASDASSKIQNILQELSQLKQLPDEIIQIHKLKNPKALERDKYPELHQKKLKEFVETAFSSLSSEEKQSVIHLYNLQFRLQIYQERLKIGQPINYENLDDDVAWFTTLKDRIGYIVFV